MASFYNSQCSAGSAAYTQGFPDLTIPAFTDMDPFLTNTGPILDPYEANRDFADDSSLYLYSIQEECMLPHYSRICSSAMFPQASYATSSALKLLHTDRGEFTLHGSHIVKSGSASPIGPATIYSGALYATTEFAEAASSPFPTSVDTLLKAIQAKQITSPRQQEVVKVSPTETKPHWFTLRTDSNTGGRAQSQPKTKKTVSVLCAPLWQELQVQVTFDHSRQSAHWCKTLCMSPQATIAFLIHSFSIQKCNAPDCKEMFSQKCNLNVYNVHLYTQALANFKCRDTRASIRESTRTAAMFAVKRLHGVIIFVHTRLFTNRSSPSPAHWIIVASSLPN
jgi:hypothetical protein